MSNPGEEFAQRLIAAQTSPAVAFFLALPRSTLKSTTLGTLLLDLADEMGVAKFDQAFFARIKVHANRMDPAMFRDSFYVCAHRKKEALEKFKAILDRKRARSGGDPYAYMGAYMPFFVQFLKAKPAKGEDRTPHSGSRFFAFSNYEFGVRECIKILRNGYIDSEHGGLTRFTQLYEIRTPDSLGPVSTPHDRLGYMLIDWEVPESKLADKEGKLRISRDELALVKGQFPLWFYRKLLDAGVVRKEDLVTSESASF